MANEERTTTMLRPADSTDRPARDYLGRMRCVCGHHEGQHQSPATASTMPCRVSECRCTLLVVAAA